MSDIADTTPTMAPTALLIIDAQVGLLDADDPDSRAVLERIAALAKRARASATPVIYMQHDGASPNHPLYPETPGWSISPLAAPQPGEPVLRKRASDSFYETPLQRELDARGVRRLVVTGAMTEFCVDTTCRSAASLGYDVTLVADAHETGDSAGLTADQKIAYHNAILADLATDHPILVIPAAEITFGAPAAAMARGAASEYIRAWGRRHKVRRPGPPVGRVGWRGARDEVGGAAQGNVSWRRAHECVTDATERAATGNPRRWVLWRSPQARMYSLAGRMRWPHALAPARCVRAGRMRRLSSARGASHHP